MQVLDCKLSLANLSSLRFDFFSVISFSSPNNFLKKPSFVNIADKHSSQHAVHITSVKEVNLMSGHM